MNFYRFRGDASHTQAELENAIVQEKLYFSTRRHLNDPLDCRPTYYHGMKFTEFRKKFLPFFDAMIRSNPSLRHQGSDVTLDRMDWATMRSLFKAEILKYVERRYLDKTSVACFTTEETDDLFWNQYSSGGTGYALCYTGIETVEETGSEGHFGKPSSTPTPITYTDKKERFSLRDLVGMFALGNADEVLSLSHKHVEYTHLCMKGFTLPGTRKKDRWKHENEYRIIQYGSGSGYFNFEGLRLEGVLLGSNSSDDLKNLVESTVTKGPRRGIWVKKFEPK